MMNQLLLPAFLLGALWLAGCEAPPEAERVAGPRAAHKVEVVTVAERMTGRREILIGALKARRVARILNREEGRIVALPYAEGDRVEQGAVVARLDTSLLEVERQKARATLGQAEQDLVRLRGLAGRKLATDEALAQAETALQVARAELERIKTRLRHTELRAPLTGLVSERLAEVGEVAPLHTHLLSLIDPASLVAVAAVPERLLRGLHPRDAVTLQIDALGMTNLPGRIRRIHPTVDPTSRQGRIEVAPASLPAAARAGQMCRVVLETEHRRRLMMPFRALRHDREGMYVMQVTDGRARRRPVRTGLRLGAEVEIREGLEAGDTVVVKGFLGLRPGMRVRVMAAPADS